MILRSYAKINLSLAVNKKLNNGLHDLQSIYSLISLHDTISIKTIKNKKKDLISIKGPFSKYVNKSNNSVRKVLNLMRKYKLISNFYQVKIYKKIPVFAGFGGGTSNAAVVLRFLNKKKIEKAIFEKISKIVGSDFKLFFLNMVL